MLINILNAKYHRNGSGVCEGFMAIVFSNKETAKEFDKGVCGNEFIATFRTKNGDESKIQWESLRIVNIKNPNLAFRGDHFIRSLEDSMEALCIVKGLTERSFSALAFPDNYKSKKKAV